MAIYREIVALSCVVLIAGCSCGPSIEEQIQQAESTLEQTNSRLSNAELVCRWGPQESADEIRERALAEWDSAVADNVQNISAEQEWEIRKSLGREMGLAPSEVNGWKQIYESRGESAKRVLAGIERRASEKERARKAQKDAACAGVATIKQNIASQQNYIADLRKQTS